MKSKGLAIVLAIFFGGLGFQKFYTNRNFSGILCLLFCWTFIPAILIGPLDALNYLFMSNETFQKRYNPQYKLLKKMEQTLDSFSNKALV